jgi:hypothetical protein
MFLGSKVRRVRTADNLTGYYEPMSRQCGILTISQPYSPVTEITLLYLLMYLVSSLTWRIVAIYREDTSVHHQNFC